MGYEDYIGNMARLVVDLVNADGATGPSPDSVLMFTEHGVPLPTADELGRLLPLLHAGVAAVAEGGPFDPVTRLLRRYPPQMSLSDHDGELHLHYAADGQPAEAWLGRTCAAALAHIASATPLAAIGRCTAAGCPNFFVDQSRNRSRRFCGNTCASRTTVAAYRARARRRDEVA